MIIKSRPHRFSEIASEAQIGIATAALAANGFSVDVVESATTAKACVLALIDPGASVFTGSSRTLDETGIAVEINESERYNALRSKMLKLDRRTQHREIKALAANPEIVVGSCQALTEDGAVMTASATGSQIGHYAFAAEKVILVCGAQKLVRDEAEGLRRIENYCLPLESERAKAAYGVPSLLSRILVMRREATPGRVHIVLVRQVLGF